MWWNDYIAVPFAEKGRGRDGVDCWGLVKLVYEERLGIILPGYDECYESTLDRGLAETIETEKQARWHQVDVPREFDAILLKQRGVPMHVGIVTKPNFMIHCERGLGTAHVRFDGMLWKSKVMGFYRYE